MGDFGGHFRQLSVQVIMLGAALCLPTILHAQNRGLANAAAHNSQHAGGTPFVSGNLPTIAFTNANLGNSPQASAVFVPAGLNVSGHVEETPFANISAGSTAVSSPASNTFVFTGSPTSFSVVSVPNESTAVAIDFTGPLSDMMRFGLVADPKQSNAPGGLPGGTLNVTGANHYDAGIAPSLILGR